jgi:hypothetical protein
MAQLSPRRQSRKVAQVPRRLGGVLVPDAGQHMPPSCWAASSTATTIFARDSDWSWSCGCLFTADVVTRLGWFLRCATPARCGRRRRRWWAWGRGYGLG